jgi:hypothetical protein
VLHLCQAWQSSAVHHWQRRDAAGQPRLTLKETESLDRAGIGADDLPTARPLSVSLKFPVGATGLVRLLELGLSVPGN